MQGMDYKKEIGSRIRKCREEKGWKLRELAAATDNVVSISRLNNYEHGTRMPGPLEAVLLGKALDRRAAYFLGVDDVQIPITAIEEKLVRNWRSLPENERMKVYRSLQAAALQYRDPVQDAEVEKHIPAPKKVPAAKRIRRSPTRTSRGASAD